MSTISSVADPKTSTFRPRSSDTSVWKRRARSSPSVVCDRVFSCCMVAMAASLVCTGDLWSSPSIAKFKCSNDVDGVIVPGVQADISLSFDCDLQGAVRSISTGCPWRSNSANTKWKKLDFLRLDGGCFSK
ncbi:hypothetical protein EYF80_044593 [Liparis tanakae]|uniref:Uncharacterized protein n=1 Tax=Liparis tanakae TaxID=230148 RepID=A0A4Z2FWF4_9TELE|nr:hypothetical protein EYF80_044593 [Liparis tanakae]